MGKSSSGTTQLSLESEAYVKGYGNPWFGRGKDYTRISNWERILEATATTILAEQWPSSLPVSPRSAFSTEGDVHIHLLLPGLPSPIAQHQHSGKNRSKPLQSIDRVLLRKTLTK